MITHTVLSSALTPSAVDFTATVAPSDATGTVTFFSSFDGQSPAPISGCADLSLTATAKDVAAVTCPVLALPPGDNEVSASYSGDTPTGYFLPSATAMTTAQTVQALCASPPSPVGLSGDGFGDRPSSTTGGVIEGTIDGGLDLRGNVYFLGRVVVNGDVNLDGGSLTMSCGSIAGDLNSRGASIVLSGGPIGIGQDLRTSEGSGLLVYGATVGGSVQVQDTSPAPFALCGTTVGGLPLLDSTFNAAPTRGGASGTICGPDAVTGDVAIRGNTLNGLDLTNLPIGGGVQVEHNQVTTGSIALSGGTVQRDAQVSDNTSAGSITLDGLSTSGDLQLQHNQVTTGSIALSGGTVQRDAQVSDNTSAGSITLDGLSTSGDLQLQHNSAGDAITVSFCTVGGDFQVDQNRASTGAISVLDCTAARDGNVHGNVAPLGVVVQSDTFGGHVHVFANGTGSDSGGGSGGSGGGNRNGGHSAHARRGSSEPSRESRGNRRH
ncbi:MAG: hypothetical protein M0004_15150 [Actinomycetota bacterium]|nr:hypothetical protein [Actinomycetota bacterium]